MIELYNELELIQNDIPNLFILNRSSIIIEDVCFVGCTLWTQAVMGVPNYIVRIKDISAEKYNYMFQRDLEYVENMINYCKQNKLRMVMISHHCPSFSLAKKKDNYKFKSLYASNLDYLFDINKIHTWVYGHVHINNDIITSGGTRMVSNQKGKPMDDVKSFVKDKVIYV